MCKFSINIVDDTRHIAVLSGYEDDPDQWNEVDSTGNNIEATFINNNIASVSLEITKDKEYKYTIDNIENLSLIVESPDGESSGLIKISEFIESIKEYDEFTLECEKAGTIIGNMMLYEKEIGIVISKRISYKKCKYNISLVFNHI